MRPTAPDFQLTTPTRGPFSHLLGVVGIVVAACAFSGCQPPTPAQKASEAAREMNMAARWGKMDDATSLTDPKHVDEFLRHRSEWHGDIRIVETELAGLNMKDAMNATVQVDVSWNFSDDPTLRTTRLSQEWSDEEGKWVMVSEERIGGDLGLFGEEVKLSLIHI